MACFWFSQILQKFLFGEGWGLGGGGEVAGIHGGGGEREGRHEIQLRSVGM